MKVSDFEVEQARAALLRTHPSGGRPPQMEIPSPIDGKVLRVLQESSTVVAPGTALIEVGDPSDLEVVVDALSSDAVSVRKGARVFLEHWGGDEPLRGVRLQFRTSLDGVVDAVVAPLEPRADPIVFQRRADPRLTDPAYLGRFTGSKLLTTTSVEFDSLVLPTGKLAAVAGQRDASNNQVFAPEKKVELEGRRMHYVYLLPEGTAPLAVIRNYQNAA